ncbi:MAG: dihydroorotase family protein [Saprospiraceae bacterium]|nr:dihydroorotase family protein [Saprospiraceae bacterium]MDW8483249.1 dihydroorotase family protein [Saprospiraceae bacterium]
MDNHLLITNARVVRPHAPTVETADIRIIEGKIIEVGPNLPRSADAEIFDANGLLAFPGLTDAHMHTGIYNPLDQDARTESRAAAMGGVTSSLNYIRTGRYYLNKGGPYRDFFPEVLHLSRENFYVDYGYHIAPIQHDHIDEMEMLIEFYGVTSFKIFMFYGAYGLHGKASKSSQHEFLMIPENEHYDIAHFEFIMRGIRKAMDSFPDRSDIISLSLHCETPEIMRAYTEIVEREGKLKGLRAYSASRPPHSEGLAIFIASYLAYETDCLNINLLHLSSRKAVDAALMMAQVFPHINFRREVTIGHLLLDYDSPAGNYAKVNPPIRSREDVEYLWQCLLERKIDWVVSDHACCSHEFKLDKNDPDNIFLAKSGFGGTEYLLSGLFSEGSKRGMTYQHMAELLCWNPAQRFGLRRKGDIAPGYDGDIVLFDPNETFTVRAAASESAQGYTPFEGMTLTGRVKHTFLRGMHIYNNGVIQGPPRGQYLWRV